LHQEDEQCPSERLQQLYSQSFHSSEQTSGHLTTGNATFYKQQLQELLQTAPQKGM
jgi:hypothetical protein